MPFTYICCLVLQRFSIPIVRFILYCYTYWIQIGLNDLWYVINMLFLMFCFLIFCLYFLLYLPVSLEGLYELRVRIFLLILIFLIITLWMTFFLVIGLYIIFRSQQFFAILFIISLSWVFLLFCLFSLFWDVVANAVGVAGSLFISPGPFSTFQSEPRIY